MVDRGRGVPERLLVVEPDGLLRWSLVTYLSRWFHVFSSDSGPAADRILDSLTVDALIVAEDVDLSAAEAVVQHARQRNAKTRVLRLAACPANPWPAVGEPAACLEKPFRLTDLALALGLKGEQGEFASPEGKASCS